MPALKYVQCISPAGLHRMAYWEWAGPSKDAPVLVCVHGLSRQGRDFDTLAESLSTHYRVISADVVGRGQSDWLGNPAFYQVPNYVADMVTLIARLDVEQVDWVGTSMGGLIGLGLASLPKSPVKKLVLNDVGPSLRFEALQRIGSYLGQPMSFANEAEGAAYLWSISKGFGPHTDEQWARLSHPLFKPGPDGRLVLHYDPMIAAPFKAITPEMAVAGEAALWAAYDSLRIPTLLLRGAESDLLSADTAQAMTERGPRARLHVIEGVGHAPMLIQPEQISVVREFLLT